MTASEKSEELIDKFVVKCIHRTQAKNCAIVCVEQIIGEWKYLNDDPETESLWSEEKEKYWNEVLEHLKNT